MKFRLLHSIMLLLASGWLVACDNKPYNGTDISGVSIGSSLPLTTHNGTKQSASGYSGKVNAVFFGYTHCPDICSPVLYRLAGIKKQLKEKGKDFQIVFITVDPKDDTPEQMKKFVSAFDADILGLTGSREEIDMVKQAYKIAAVSRVEKNVGKRISHSGNIFIYDRNGKIRLLFREDSDPSLITADIRRLLQE